MQIGNFRIGEERFNQWLQFGTLLLVAGVGVYDLATRRRLHLAYIAAALWIIANELIADWLSTSHGGSNR
jgi:hypothetical protein